MKKIFFLMFTVLLLIPTSSVAKGKHNGLTFGLHYGFGQSGFMRVRPSIGGVTDNYKFGFSDGYGFSMNFMKNKLGLSTGFSKVSSVYTQTWIDPNNSGELIKAAYNVNYYSVPLGIQRLLNPNGKNTPYIQLSYVLNILNSSSYSLASDSYTSELIDTYVSEQSEFKKMNNYLYLGIGYHASIDALFIDIEPNIRYATHSDKITDNNSYYQLYYGIKIGLSFEVKEYNIKRFFKNLGGGNNETATL